MRIELTEVMWFEEHAVTLRELAELSGLAPALLDELVSYSAIVPLDPSTAEPRFGADALSAARNAQRLRQDFDLDTPGLLVALGLLDRVHELERQLRSARARMPAPLR
jgi:chaperone modulatory protein CbpM